MSRMDGKKTHTHKHREKVFQRMRRLFFDERPEAEAVKPPQRIATSAPNRPLDLEGHKVAETSPLTKTTEGKWGDERLRFSVFSPFYFYESDTLLCVLHPEPLTSEGLWPAFVVASNSSSICLIHRR